MNYFKTAFILITALETMFFGAGFLHRGKFRNEITEQQALYIYHCGWIDGRLAQVSKQYFRTDSEMRWKRDSIYFVTNLDSLLVKP